MILCGDRGRSKDHPWVVKGGANPIIIFLLCDRDICICSSLKQDRECLLCLTSISTISLISIQTKVNY